MRITPRHLRSIFVCVSVLSLVVLAGCGGKEAAQKNLILTGKVTYKGEPVTGGKLTLYPADTKTAIQVDTRIQGDGNYSIIAPGTGEMKVTIETESLRGMPGGGEGGPYIGAPKGAKQPKMDQSQIQKYKKIPKKYSDPNTTDLKVTIVGGKGETVQNFDLKD